MGEPGEHDDSEMIQFGGLPVRWPFGGVHLPRMPRLPPAVRADVSRASVAIGLAALAVGLLIGFFGGRLTAHRADHKARSFSPLATPVVLPQFATTAIGLTGARCAVQAGNNLQLGIEIMNETRSPVTLGAISPMFPMGGLRAISSGVGACGALPPVEIPPSGSLAPGAAEWIHATIAVREGCPEPLPVWFKVGYASSGKTGTAMLAGFPDLGPVSYRHCKDTDSSASSVIIATVDPGTGHSSGG
jgi:hypothetical protein